MQEPVARRPRTQNSQAQRRIASTGERRPRGIQHIRLRHGAASDQGWDRQSEAISTAASATPTTHDRAVHVLGWDGEEPIATGRIVVPPGPLAHRGRPVSIGVEPRGQRGRRRPHDGRPQPSGTGPRGCSWRSSRGSISKCAPRGFDVACGMMSPRARSLVRLLGLQIEVLGDDRPLLGEPRAPVRFSCHDRLHAARSTRWRLTQARVTARPAPAPYSFRRSRTSSTAPGRARSRAAASRTTSSAICGIDLRSPATGGTMRSAAIAA